MTFLARPRSKHAEHAIEHGKDAGVFEWVGMGILALLTIILGLFASSITQTLTSIASRLHGIAPTGPLVSLEGPVLSTGSKITSDMAMPIVFLGLLVAGVITYFVVSAISRRQTVTVSRTWDCGFPLSPRMEMTGTAFARSILLIFRGLVRPTKQTSIIYHDSASRYLVKSHTVDLGVHDVYHKWFYDPIAASFIFVSERTRKLQTGNLNTYVLYIFITLVALLFYSLYVK
jgi:hydrogenase-4 component B